MILSPTIDNIQIAASRLIDGGVIGMPTETVYGLAADATNDAACRMIFTLKGRPTTNPLIVHCNSVRQVYEYAQIHKDIEELFKKVAALWPGPLTIILPSIGKIASSVLGGLRTIGVRIPNHQVALDLIDKVGKPLAAPSANKFMSISPTTSEHVAKQFGEELPIILDGGQCQIGLESTIIELLSNEIIILRPGAITQKQLQETTAVNVRYADRKGTPGSFVKHYSPNTPTVLLSKISPEEIPADAILLKFTSLPDTITSKFTKIIALTSSGTLDEAAFRLYSCLYEADAANPSLIVIEDCVQHGIGYALTDRINKATADE